TPFEAAPVVFECERTEMGAWGWREHSPSYPRTCFIRRPDFFHTAFYVEDGSGARQQVDIPADAYLSVERNWLILNLRSDWAVAGQHYKAGALLVTDIDALLAGTRDFTVLFEPTRTCFLQHFAAAGNVVAFKVLDNVRSRVLLARHQNGAWRVEPPPGLPRMQTGDLFRPVEGDIDWLRAEGAQRGEVVHSAHRPTTPPQPC